MTGYSEIWSGPEHKSNRRSFRCAFRMTAQGGWSMFLADDWPYGIFTFGGAQGLKPGLILGVVQPGTYFTHQTGDMVYSLFRF
jgi:hypothetical protein